MPTTVELAIEGFERLGGRGGLKPHYASIERICAERNLACPTESNVRIAIYNYTPGRKSFLGRDAFFEIVGRGEYRLIQYRLDQL
jgi:hypothetical protein